MADTGGKRQAKAKRETASVLGNLPATRPPRLGRPRAGAADAPAPSRGATPAAAPKPAGGRRRAAQPGAAPKPPSGRRRAAQPGAAAKPAAEAAVEPGAPKPRRPAAVRPGVRSLEHQQRAGDPPPARSVQAPRGAELVTTTIQAVGELAQIGLTVGGRALKRAVDRLPRP
jgi:hypothetical protein